MVSPDPNIVALRAILVGLCKRSGLSLDRLRTTEIDVAPLLELFVVQQQVRSAGGDPPMR